MTKNNWKILIVDDDSDTLLLAQNILKNYKYDGRGLDLLLAKSSSEAKDLLIKNKNIAFILLDVVMETNHAGLDLVRFVREDLKDNKIRIILRTGFPGEAPEQMVIQKFDINDYEEKPELTPDKLLSKLTLGLRSYSTITKLYELEEEFKAKTIEYNELNQQLLKTNSELKKTKEVADETLLKLEITLESGKADYWEMDLIKGTLSYSDRWARLLGYEPGEVAPTIEGVMQIIHPEDIPKNLLALQNYVDRKTSIYDSECRLKTKSGHWIWISTRGKANEWDDDGKPIRLVGVNYDITDRKEFEEKLFKKEQQLAEAQRIAGLGSWEWDAKADTVVWSKQLYQLAKLDENLPAPSYAEHPKFYTTESMERLSKAVEEALKTGIPYKLDLQMVCTDGSTKWISARAEPVYNESNKLMGLKGTVLDISDREKAEQELIEKSQELDQYFNSALDLLCIADTNGYFRRLNPEWTNVLGYTVEELEGRQFMDFVHPEDKDATLQVLETLSKQITVVSFKNRYLHKNGTYRILEWRSFPKDKLIYAIARDITQSEQAEKDLKESEEKYSKLFHETIDGCALQKLVFDKNNKPVDYITLDVNEAFENILHVKKENVMGKMACEFLPRDELNKWLKLFVPVAINGGNCFYENFSPENNAYFEGNVFSPQKNHFATIFRDVTERKLAEEKLKDSEHRFRFLFENMQEGFAYCQMLYENSNPIDFIYITVNEKFESLTGLKNVIGRKVSEVIPGIMQSDDELFQIYGKVCKTRKPEKFEFYLTSLSMWFSVSVHSPAENHFVAIFDVITERKRTEEALKISEMRFRELSDLLPQTIYEADLKGKLTYANQSAFKSFGYTSSDLENGLNIMDMVAPENIQHSRKSMLQILSREAPLGKEYVAVRKDKTIFPIIIYSAPILIDGKVKGFRGSIIDITERKRAEDALLESEQKYRLLYENAGVGIGTYSPNGTILSYNTIAANYMKGKPEDFAGKSIYDVFPKDDADFYMSRIKNAESSELPQEYLDSIELPDGKKWLLSVFTRIPDPHNKTIGIQIISTDISAQKNADELVRASEEKFRNAFEHAAFAIALVNTQKKFISVNNAFCLMLGYSEEEILNKMFSEITHPDDIEKGLELTKEMYEGKREYFWLEKRYLHKNGAVVWGLLSTSLVHDSKHNPLFSIAQIQNITDRKKAEEELIFAKEKAEESDRLKTAFLQNMSHEIRTPLNAIVGFSGRLNKPDLSEEKRQNFAKIITDSSKYLLSIVSDILTISSIDTNQEKLNLREVCVNDLIVELLSIFKSAATEKNISLFSKQNLTDKCSKIYADKTKLEQILSNLLSNALKFTHEGFIEFGYTLVQTRHALSQPTISQLQFFVKDTGIGIKPEMHHKIFERFRQAELSITKNYGGTGLGLSISKGFVELMGGKIWVESELGKGAAFFFTIPYRPVFNVDEESEEIESRQNPCTILVVEDEEYNYLLIEELLMNMNFNILHSKDGQEAVDLCKINQKIDLILMDIKMPGMDGYTAAGQIKKFRPDVPIVAQTALALENEIEKYSSVFEDYITKPIDETEFKLKVMSYFTLKTTM